MSKRANSSKTSEPVLIPEKKANVSDLIIPDYAAGFSTPLDLVHTFGPCKHCCSEIPKIVAAKPNVKKDYSPAYNYFYDDDVKVE